MRARVIVKYKTKKQARESENAKVIVNMNNKYERKIQKIYTLY